MTRKKDAIMMTDRELYLIVCGLQWLSQEGNELADKIKREFRDKYDRGRAELIAQGHE